VAVPLRYVVLWAADDHVASDPGRAPTVQSHPLDTSSSLYTLYTKRLRHRRSRFKNLPAVSLDTGRFTNECRVSFHVPQTVEPIDGNARLAKT